MFLNINDTFKLMEQLANIAMRQLLDNEAFAADRSLPKPCKTLKNVSALKRSHLPQNRVWGRQGLLVSSEWRCCCCLITAGINL